MCEINKHVYTSLTNRCYLVLWTDRGFLELLCGKKWTQPQNYKPFHRISRGILHRGYKTSFHFHSLSSEIHPTISLEINVKTEGAIKNGQSIETGNIGHTRRRKTAKAQRMCENTTMHVFVQVQNACQSS
jgi:hypothetical protein